MPDYEVFLTPSKVVDACIRRLPIGVNDSVLEPSCGDKAFVRGLRRAGHRGAITTVDIRSEVNPDWCGDFLAYRPSEKPDWIIGNPPWSTMTNHVRHAINISRIGVAMIGPLRLIESEEREGFWKEYMPSAIHAFTKRVSYTGATPKFISALFVWDKQSYVPATTFNLIYKDFV